MVLFNYFRLHIIVFVLFGLGFLHSGDLGKLDKNKNVAITGRIKELLITAGGESNYKYNINRYK